MTEILFIRHAATDLAGTFCGHADPSLNTLGKAQLKDLIQTLASHRLDSIYSSDLQRCTETAHTISEAFEIPYFQHADLREISFGEWEGLTWNEIEQHDPQYAQTWMTEFPAYPAPGGETYADFKARVHRALDQLSRRFNGKRIAVVTHAGVMRCVLEAWHGYTPQQAWNCTSSYCCSFLHTIPSCSHGRSR